MGKIQSIEEAFFNLSEGLKEANRAPNIKKYKPHTKQAQFHKSTKKKKLYIGGNRSGKTTGGVCEDIWRATCRHPFNKEVNLIGPNRGRVVAVDFTQGVEKIILPQFKQWLYPSALKGGAWETAYDKQLKTLHFSNGSFIEFMSYDQDLDKFAGTSRHWIHFDEEPPKTIYVECMARLIDTDGDFWITMTPVEGMTWVHDDLYEPNYENPDGSVEVIEVDMLENPYLTENAIKSFTDSIDEDERKARLQGKFVQQGGRIYKTFDPTVGGLHVLKDEFEHPKQRFKDWMWILSLDHGLSNPTAVLWSAIDRNGFIITFHEHYQSEWTVDKHAAYIHETNQRFGRVPDLFIADPSIVNRNAVSGTSIQQEYASHGIGFGLANNDVKAGIIRVKRYINPTTKMGDNGLPIPKWRVTPNCTNLIWEMKRYRWKTYANKKLTYENNTFEEPHKKDDHACDALRYMIMSQADLAAPAPDSEENVNRIIRDLGLVTTSDSYDVADPWDLEAHPTWTHGDSTIRGQGQWEYDEHMGGIY